MLPRRQMAPLLILPLTLIFVLMLIDQITNTLACLRRLLSAADCYFSLLPPLRYIDTARVFYYAIHTYAMIRHATLLDAH